MTEHRNILTVYSGTVPECDTHRARWWECGGGGEGGVLQKRQCLEGNIQYCGEYKNTNCSAYYVALLSIQQYRVQVNSFKVRVSSPRWRVIVATVCGMWIVGALYDVSSTLTQFLCEKFENLDRIMYYLLVVIFRLLVPCVLRVCVIACTYIMTARHLVEGSYSI